jgi:hypothetical protein
MVRCVVPNDMLSDVTAFSTFVMFRRLHTINKISQVASQLLQKQVCRESKIFQIPYTAITHESIADLRKLFLLTFIDIRL